MAETVPEVATRNRLCLTGAAGGGGAGDRDGTKVVRGLPAAPAATASGPGNPGAARWSAARRRRVLLLPMRGGRGRSDHQGARAGGDVPPRGPGAPTPALGLDRAGGRDDASCSGSFVFFFWKEPMASIKKEFEE